MNFFFGIFKQKWFLLALKIHRKDLSWSMFDLWVHVAVDPSTERWNSGETSWKALLASRSGTEGNNTDQETWSTWWDSERASWVAIACAASSGSCHTDCAANDDSSESAWTDSVGDDVVLDWTQCSWGGTWAIRDTSPSWNGCENSGKCSSSGGSHVNGLSSGSVSDCSWCDQDGNIVVQVRWIVWSMKTVSWWWNCDSLLNGFSCGDLMCTENNLGASWSNWTMGSCENGTSGDDWSTAQSSASSEAHQETSLVGMSSGSDHGATNNSCGTVILGWNEELCNLTTIPESGQVSDRDDFGVVNVIPFVSSSWSSQNGENCGNDQFHFNQSQKLNLVHLQTCTGFYTRKFLSVADINHD